MQTYQVFKAGNSKVVALNDDLAQSLGLQLGVKVIQQKVKNGLLIKPLSKKVEVPGDLKKWLTSFENRHSKALRELAQK